jgi:hypothetical protein
LDGGVLGCCLSLVTDREAEVVCGCLMGSFRSPRGVLFDRASLVYLAFLVCGVVAYRLGGEVGVELLKRALKVVRVVMVVILVGCGCICAGDDGR